MTCAQTNGGLVVDAKTIRGEGAVTLVDSTFFVGDGATAALVVASAGPGMAVLVGATSDGEDPGNEVGVDKIGVTAGTAELGAVFVG